MNIHLKNCNVKVNLVYLFVIVVSDKDLFVVYNMSM